MQEVIRIGNVGGGNTQSRTVYLIEGISPTLCSGMSHGNTIPYILDVKHLSKEEVISICKK